MRRIASIIKDHPFVIILGAVGTIAGGLIALHHFYSTAADLFLDSATIETRSNLRFEISRADFVDELRSFAPYQSRSFSGEISAVNHGNGDAEVLAILVESFAVASQQLFLDSCGWTQIEAPRRIIPANGVNIPIAFQVQSDIWYTEQLASFANDISIQLIFKNESGYEEVKSGLSDVQFNELINETLNIIVFWKDNTGYYFSFVQKKSNFRSTKHREESPKFDLCKDSVERRTIGLIDDPMLPEISANVASRKITADTSINDL